MDIFRVCSFCSFIIYVALREKSVVSCLGASIFLNLKFNKTFKSYEKYFILGDMNEKIDFVGYFYFTIC